MTTITVDRTALEAKVKDTYTAVADRPDGEFHFEMGRAMAERLGYAPADLDRVPREAIDSFAGVGYFFDFAALEPGEHVADLGSGSGMDTFVAALKVGPTGHIVGIDMTDARSSPRRRVSPPAVDSARSDTRRDTSRTPASMPAHSTVLFPTA